MSKVLLSLVEDLDRVIKREEDKTVKVINNVLTSAFNRLEFEVINLYPQYAQDKNKLPNTRTLLLLEQLTKFLSLITPESKQEFIQRYEALLEQASQLGISFAESAHKEYAEPVAYSLGQNVNINAVAFAARSAGDRLVNASDQFKDGVKSQIAYHIAIGSSTRNTAASLRKHFGLLKTRAETIARTETIAALAAATDEFYERNEVDYVQLYATSDDRSCRFCTGRNQSVYKRGTIVIPLHPRCRCYLAPFKVDWYEEGLFDRDFSVNYYNEVLQSSGIEVDRGLAPFEKSNGLKHPPKPIWNPYTNKLEL